MEGNGGALGPGGLSLTRDDLSRILKFGASKLWKQSQPKGCGSGEGNNKDGGGEETNGIDEEEKDDEQKEVDLDLILAEAEVTVTEAGTGGGGGGLADSLLSSYQNIQEFKYEPTAVTSTKGSRRGGGNVSSSFSGTAAGTSQEDFEGMNDAEFWQKCIPQAERQKLKKDKQEELIVYGKRKTRNNLFLGQIFDSGLDSREERFGGGGRGRSRGGGSGGGAGDLTGGTRAEAGEVVSV